MKFTKMQGAGNDFILVEGGPGSINWPDTARMICDRHYGIGADGLLVIMPSEKATFFMRVFNADGTEPVACGNGMRCMVRYYLDTHAADVHHEAITVETTAGIRRVKVTDGEKGLIQTFMGEPGFDEQDIPMPEGSSFIDVDALRYCEIKTLQENIRLNIVSMGNPHAVYFIDEPVKDYDLSVIGPEIASDVIFPEGTNFEAARVLDRHTIEVRVWERGVGETLACGSGACAVAVAAFLKEYTDGKVDILLPGGVLHVAWDGEGEVILSGPAETVFTGEWSD